MFAFAGVLFGAGFDACALLAKGPNRSDALQPFCGGLAQTVSFGWAVVAFGVAHATNIVLVILR